jgi:hypothetical protein
VKANVDIPIMKAMVPNIEIRSFMRFNTVNTNE